MNHLLFKLILTTEVNYDKEEFESILPKTPSEIAEEIRNKARAPEGLSWTLNLFHIMAQDGESQNKASEVIEIFEKNIPDYRLLQNIIERSKTPQNISENGLFESLTEILYASENPFDRLGSKILFNRENITEKDFAKAVDLIKKQKPIPLNIVLAINEMEPQKAAKWLNRIVNIQSLHEKQLHAFLGELKNNEILPHVCSELIKQGHMQTLEKIFQSKPEWLGHLAISTDPALLKSFLFQINIHKLKINFETVLKTIFNYNPEKFILLWKSVPSILRRNVLASADIIPQDTLEEISKELDEDEQIALSNSPNLPIERKIILIHKKHIDILKICYAIEKKIMRGLLIMHPRIFNEVLLKMRADDSGFYPIHDIFRMNEDSVSPRHFFLFDRVFGIDISSNKNALPFKIESISWINILNQLSPEDSAFLIRSYLYSRGEKGYSYYLFNIHEPFAAQIVDILLNLPIINTEIRSSQSDEKRKEILIELIKLGCHSFLITYISNENLKDLIGKNNFDRLSK